MKNIHILSTDKLSRLYYWEDKLRIGDLTTAPKNLGITNQNIYITSDEKFVRDEYVTDGIEVIKASPKLVNAQGLVDRRGWKKIILTTNQDLIKDGVQAIGDEFLEFFVKNPSCEYVEFKTFIKTYEDGCSFDKLEYKIIIPKEEPKPMHEQIIEHCGGEEKFKEIAGLKPKQETLEEAAKKYLEVSKYMNLSLTDYIKFGAKWQQEKMYSEEDMRKAFKSSSLTNMLDVYDSFEEFIEQFKNK
jgi:hypothetical protein